MGTSASGAARGAPQRVAGAAAAERRDAGAGRRAIMRATRYAVKPMSVDDAALRIEASAEPFVVFRNAETDAVSVLYRRKDGQLRPDRAGLSVTAGPARCRMALRMTASQPDLPASPSRRCCAIWRRLAAALDVELLAGADGARPPHHQPAHPEDRPGAAGFDAYLRGGRVLIFGESEIRYLESLDAAARDAPRCAGVFATTSRAC